MCLTIPKQVISVKGGKAVIKHNKAREEAGSLVKIKKGDWVLMQNGVIIKKITAKQAKEINKLTQGVIPMA